MNLTYYSNVLNLFCDQRKKGMPGWNYKTIYIYDWKIKIYNQDHQIFFLL